MSHKPARAHIILIITRKANYPSIGMKTLEILNWIVFVTEITKKWKMRKWVIVNKGGPHIWYMIYYSENEWGRDIWREEIKQEFVPSFDFWYTYSWTFTYLVNFKYASLYLHHTFCTPTFKFFPKYITLLFYLFLFYWRNNAHSLESIYHTN